MSTSTPLEPLFKELDNYIQKTDYEHAIAICDQILKVNANDSDAFQCKCICLIQQSKFEEAIKFMDANSKLSASFLFERAYCYYRNKQLNESMSILKGIPSPKSLQVRELEAQVYYRLEDFTSAAKIYEQIIEEQKTMVSPELATNLLACYAATENSQQGEKFVDSHKKLLQENFDFAYNAACAAIEIEDWNSAEKYLHMAEKICRESLTEDGLKPEEIQDELSVIHTQLGYVHQMNNKTEEALKLYNMVLKNKPSDESVAAVASNNVVVLKREHDLFDSFKKLKQATSQTLEQKLSTNQKKVIGFNRCLLLLHMGKGDQCRELVKMLQDQFPDSDRLVLILSSLYLKEKKAQKSEELLKNFIAQYPEKSLRAQLSLAQISLTKGDIKGAITILESIPSLKNKPGMVATLVSLYEQIHEIDSAIKCLDEYVTWWESQPKKNDDQYIKILKENANYKLKNKRFKEAAAMFEKVIKLNKNDLEALPSLVIAYSQFDPSLAEKIDARIPALQNETKVDGEALENLSAPKIGRAQKEDPDNNNKTSKPSKPQAKKKKKKKRLPKNYDPNKPPDAERWIPLKQRSYFKKRTRKGKLEKGSQGGGVIEKRSIQLEKSKSNPSVSGAATPAATTPSASTTTPPPTSPKVTSNQPAQVQLNQPPAKQQQQKKKGNKKKRR